MRTILVDLVTRLGTHGAEVDESDSSEMVAVQILAKCDGSAIRASNLIRDAETLEEIFHGTSLHDAAKAASKVGDRPTKQIPLPRGKDLELAKHDAGECIDEIWDAFVQQIEKTAGEQSQTFQVTGTWHPPTGNRDGYVGVHSNTTVKSRKRTRTGQVTKKSRGGHQFALFAEPADEGGD